jgi:FtsZ-binding cell division protein ZapB
LQSEIVTLKTEHDDLVAENAVLKERVEALREKNEALKDQIIDVLLKKSID